VERPRHTRPWRTALNSLFILLMGMAIGYSMWPVLHSGAEESSGSARTAKKPVSLASLPDTPFDAVIWPGRHLIITVSGTKLDADTQAFLQFVRPGAIVLRKDNLQTRGQVVALIDAIKTATGLGQDDTSLPLIALDLRDVDIQALGLQEAPSIATLASIGNADAARKLGQTYAGQYARLGIAMVITSVLDVFDPATLPTNPNAYEAATTMAVAYLSGAREGGVIPVASGFPGNRAAQSRPGVAVPALEQESYDLAKIMYSFIEAVSGEAKIPALMVSHVAVPTLDENFPSRPASLSPMLVQNVLRSMCRYDGVIVSEDIAGHPAVASQPTERVAVQALTAGCDAVLMLDADPQTILAVCAAIQTAVFLDTLSREELTASKARLDTLQNWLRASDRPARGAGADAPPVTARRPPAPALGPAPGLDAHYGPATPPTLSITRETPVETPRLDTPDEVPVALAAPPAPSRVTEHTVVDQESLMAIANQYGETVKNLITWNNLLEPNVEPGQVLRVAPPEPDTGVPGDDDGDALEASEAADIGVAAADDAPLPDAAVEGVAEGAATDAEVAAPGTAAKAAARKTVGHTIAPGDTLYKIAVKYNSTPERIMAMNNIKNPNHILLGQTIRVPAPKEE
jgi:beta-N-acetylhexosaminidase